MNSPSLLLASAIAVAAGLFTPLISASDEPPGLPGVDYLQEIKPLFQERCYSCHGALKQEAGLRLDTAAATRAGGNRGPVITPSDPDQSPLLLRLQDPDPEERMPREGEPLDPADVQKIRHWIAQGAPGPPQEKSEPAPEEHWAFVPPVRPAAPTDPVPPGDHPLDALIHRDLYREGFRPQPEAPPALLLRRLYLDLIGLPPTVHEGQAFLTDPSPNAYQRVVDRLLASPRHGERWGRHWMDVWRYSDWYGRRNVPDVWNSAPQIWRWRDWIVNSLNADKGYGRMLEEMLAGDELSPEDPAVTVATGYLVRNWYALNPNDWMRNTVEHTGKAFLGLTFNCAHCHDHKYDPITHDDYFRLRAFFEPMGIRQDWVPGQPDPGPFQEYEYSTRREVQRLGAVRVYDQNAAAPTWFYTGGDERQRVEERGSIQPGVPDILTRHGSPGIEERRLPPRAWHPGLDPAIQATARAQAKARLEDAEVHLQTLRASTPPPDSLSLTLALARVTAAETASLSLEARIRADEARFQTETPCRDHQTTLAREANRSEREVALAAARVGYLEARDQQATLQRAPSPDESAIETAGQTLTEKEWAWCAADAALKDPPSETYTSLSPTYPSTSTGRRSALARWITHRGHPLTARVAVNHVWMRHFHRPLVPNVYDFGRSSQPPTHPAVLDWLAVELMESNWSLKMLHRHLVTSQTYRRTSAVSPRESQHARDPENQFYWRMNTGRMEAEPLRDSLLHVAKTLNLQMGGQELENDDALTTWRRSLYYSVHPEQGGSNALGELFDPPDPSECYRRTRSIVPQQALALTNSQLIHQLSRQVAQDWHGADPAATDVDTHSPLPSDDAIANLFHRVLSRPPTAAEMAHCLRAWPTLAENGVPLDAAAALIRVLFNHNDFLTIR